MARLNVCVWGVKITTRRGVGTSSTAAILNAARKCCDGRLPSGSDRRARPNKDASVTMSVNASVVRPIGIESLPPTSQSNHQSQFRPARGHAASLIPKIFVIDLAVTIQFDQRGVVKPNTAVTTAGEMSIVCGIVNAST